MADGKSENLTQYSQIYSLSIPAGIKRDGTIFQNDQFTDGVWCRFQRLDAKKMGGYKQIFAGLTGIYRGMVVQPYNGVNYLFAGNANGLDVFTTGTTFPIGSGPFTANILPGTTYATVSSNTTTTLTIAGDVRSVFPSGTTIIFDQSNPVTHTVSTTPTYTSPNTTVTFTPALSSGTVTKVWIDNTPVFSPDPSQGPYRLTWQFDAQFSPSGGQLNVFAHPGLNLVNIDNGVPSQVLVGPIISPDNATWTFTGLSDSAGQNPTYQPISVDGGVCVLYPFIFVYGSHGYIANNNVSTPYSTQSFYDWNGPLANQVNVSASKIVKGMPTRGGTNSPSGLFWSTDSLIRVSFNSQAVNNYWSYDIISSQISIMSSNAVVEMDGTFFWMGVDRFYLYNGSVQVLSNDKNVNWLFDNLNYEQRQKVWATKVPRYNEIWFFYPRGSATECTDAIIYNVKDKLWYDAGSAVGAQRSCGYPVELFPTPIWADWNYSASYGTPLTIIAHPASLAAPNSKQFYLYGDQTPVLSPGDTFSFSNIPQDTVYTVASSQNIYNTTIGTPGVTLVTATAVLTPSPTVGGLVYPFSGGFPIWQHEFGTNAISFNGESAVYSSITTSDISWLTGSPSGDQLVGVNRRMHLRRFEPNFLQSGTMYLTVLGRKFAGGMDGEEDSEPIPFTQNTGKIDLRIEQRLIRLKFESNDIDGNFEMGRNLITAEFGDERP
jgi:hypothetical protein